MSQVDRRQTSLREINIEARRRRILDAARALIARGGMPALTMRKLAAEAGLSVTTLYNLYGVREDILHALIDDAVDRMVDLLDAQAPLDDPFERCRAVVTVSIEFFTENEAIYRPMVVATYEGLALACTSDRRTAHRAAEMQREGIEAAIEKGLLRPVADPLRLAEQIYHGYEFACCQWGFGLLDADGFETRALYGLYVALLAAATEASRPFLEARLRELEPALAATAAASKRPQPDQRRSS